MSAPAAALCGLATGFGVWLMIDGSRRRDRVPARSVGAAIHRLGASVSPVRFAGVLAATAVTGVVTRWPVGVILAGLAAWSLPTVLRTDHGNRDAQMKLEAIATWTENLRDTLSAAAGLEEAIAATAFSAPPPIRAQVIALALAIDGGTRVPDALRPLATELTRLRLPEALRQFAADLDHPAGDMVAASLLLAATRQARDLAEQLGELAAAARERAAARMRIQTEWATTGTSVRVIIALTLVMAVGQILFNRAFLAPFSTAGGQVVLAVIGALFGAGFAWLARMGRIRDDDRVLTPEAIDSPAEVAW